MKIFLIIALVCASGTTHAQFGKARADAIAVGLDGGEPQDAAATEESASQAEAALAAEYSTQRDREISEAISQIFQMAGVSTRSTDPFGAAIGVPLREAVASPGDDTGVEGESESAASAVQQVREGFSTAVRGIDIRGVNPGRGEFLSGSDNIFEGDVVDISGSGGVFRIWVVEVSEDGVTVMDDRTKRTEKVTLTLGIQPISPRGWGANGTVMEAPPF